MITVQHRIKEFKTRQVYYEDCFTIRLNKVKKTWFYTTFVWTRNSVLPIKVDSGKYHDEDPYSLIDIAESMMPLLKSGRLQLTPELVRDKAKKGIKTRKENGS